MSSVDTTEPDAPADAPPTAAPPAAASPAAAPSLAAHPLAATDRPASGPAVRAGGRKGRQTRAWIVQSALELAAERGLEGLTIGLVAEQTQMSKSGVFAHFGSREDMQIAVLKSYEQIFVDEVLKPALVQQRGLPRVRAIMDNWFRRTEAGIACLWVSSAADYDDRPGPVRDTLVSMREAWKAELQRAVQQAVKVGHLRAETDVDDLIKQLHGLVLVLHHDVRLMHSSDAGVSVRRGLDRVLAHDMMPRAGA